MFKKTSEKTKNYTGITNENEGDGARMYETGTKMCPVASFEKYLKKRNPACDALLQYPRNSFCDDDVCWFENRPLGKNSIGEFLSKLSKEANLSDVYTNHCIRATTITLLNDVGFKDRDIISVSGHRNEKSLASYVSDTKPDVKRKMSGVLSSAVCNNNALVPYTHDTGSLSTAPSCTSTATGIDAVQYNMQKDFSMIDYLDSEYDDSDNDLLNALASIEKTVSLPSVHTGTVEVVTQSKQISNTMTVPNFNFSNCVVNIYNK